MVVFRENWNNIWIKFLPSYLTYHRNRHTRLKHCLHAHDQLLCLYWSPQWHRKASKIDYRSYSPSHLRWVSFTHQKETIQSAPLNPRQGPQGALQGSSVSSAASLTKICQGMATNRKITSRPSCFHSWYPWWGRCGGFWMVGMLTFCCCVCLSQLPFPHTLWRCQCCLSFPGQGLCQLKIASYYLTRAESCHFRQQMCTSHTARHPHTGLWAGEAGIWTPKFASRSSSWAEGDRAVQAMIRRHKVLTHNHHPQATLPLQPDLFTYSNTFPGLWRYFP